MMSVVLLISLERPDRCTGLCTREISEGFGTRIWLCGTDEKTEPVVINLARGPLPLSPEQTVHRRNETGGGYDRRRSTREKLKQAVMSSLFSSSHLRPHRVSS